MCTGHTFLPIAVALVQRDEVFSLLAGLGAATVPVSRLLEMNALQWTSAMVAGLQTATAPKPIQEPPTSPAGDSWAEYRAYLVAVMPNKTEDSATIQGRFLGAPVPQTFSMSVSEEYTLATMDYYTRAESILRFHSATSPQALQSGATLSEQTTGALTSFARQYHNPIPQGSGYLRHGKSSTPFILAHLKVFYDELYEACWTGDNEFIQDLCLPKDTAEGKELIQISVQTRDSVAGSTASGML
jgi:hypothetical protein